MRKTLENDSAQIKEKGYTILADRTQEVDTRHVITQSVRTEI